MMPPSREQVRPLQQVRPSSPLARLDPRVRIIASLIFLVVVFGTSSWAGLGVVALVTVVLLPCAHITPANLARQLAPLLPLMCFILVFDALFVHEGDVLFRLGALAVSSGGLSLGAQGLLRLACALAGTGALMRHASPTQVSDAVCLLAAPFRPLWRVSADIGVALGLVLRFIPILQEEYRAIRAAQEARLASFEGGLVTRLSHAGPLLVPLLARSLQKSQRLAWALANREYDQHDVRRSLLRSYRMKPADWVVLALFGAMLALLAL